MEIQREHWLYEIDKLKFDISNYNAQDKNTDFILFVLKI